MSVKGNGTGQATYWDTQVDAHFPVFSTINTVNSHRIKDVSVHFHNCMEFLYARTNIDIDIFGTDHLKIQAGDVVLFYPHVSHSVSFDNGASSAFDVLYINGELLLDFIDQFPSDLQFPSRNVYHPSYKIFNVNTNIEICKTVDNIIKEFAFRKYGWRFYVIISALLLLALIERVTAQKPDKQIKRESTVEIRPALNFINNNYAEHIDLSLLSELCHMSQATFRRKFKEIMTCTPLDYIHSMRVQHACMMLRGTAKPITEISSAVGFDSISSFNRQFLSIKGISPKQYRAILPESQLSDSPID